MMFSPWQLISVLLPLALLVYQLIPQGRPVWRFLYLWPAPFHERVFLGGWLMVVKKIHSSYLHNIKEAVRF
jgi:hypothetical protein